MSVQFSKESYSYPKDTPLQEINYLVIDVQTTGASPKQAHLLECAYQVFRFNDDTGVQTDSEIAVLEPVEAKVCLVELPPGVRLTRVISKLTGIKVKHLQNAKKPSVLAQELWEVIGCITQDIHLGKAWVCLAHVARYEHSFIRALCLAHRPKNLSQAEARDCFDLIPWLCTHAISTRLFPSLPRRSLNAMNAYFGGTEIKVKRAAAHLEASCLIWRSLHEILETKELSTWGKLEHFLSQSAKRSRFKPSLPAKLRLEAPNLPGVYTFYDQRSTVVYVGRARNLNQRVNQHFRGQKGHDERHLELLGVTHHVDWQTCASVLEAKRLENQKIKELSPRYNRALTDQSIPFYLKADDCSVIEASLVSGLVGNDTKTLTELTGPWIDERLIERLRGFRAVLVGNFSSIHQNYWPNQALDLWQVARKLIVAKLEQINARTQSIFSKDFNHSYDSIYNFLSWGQTIEHREFLKEKESKLSAESSEQSKEKSVILSGEEEILSSCESLMLQLWQTWQAAQWQTLLQHGEIIWLADTGRSQKAWRMLDLNNVVGSEYISQEPQVDDRTKNLKDIIACGWLPQPLDRLTYDQSRLTYLSILSLSREGIASYYRSSSQDSWFRLDLSLRSLS